MEFLLKIRKTPFLLICFLSDLFLSFLGSKILNLQSQISFSLNFKEEYIFNLLIVILFAPLFETFIYQFSIIELAHTYIKKYYTNYIAIFISATLFAFSHLYNIHYFIYSFLIGVNFALIYIVAKKRKDVNPVLLLFSVHSITNSIGFTINELFKINF